MGKTAEVNRNGRKTEKNFGDVRTGKGAGRLLFLAERPQSGLRRRRSETLETVDGQKISDMVGYESEGEQRKGMAR